jgi:hypothetical protein
MRQNEVVEDLRQRRPSAEQIIRIGKDTSKARFSAAYRGAGAAQEVVAAGIDVSLGASQIWVVNGQGKILNGDRTDLIGLAAPCGSGVQRRTLHRQARNAL